MAVCKCKMCGGDLNITELDRVAVCEYCGTSQTVPSADNEKKMTLFNRANRLRLNNEFDKAAGIYESIIAGFPEEAEAYWGVVLCKYGIEYVDDPATGKKIPTCHRSSFDSVMEDENFEQACENADILARRVYREEAKRIEEIRKGIIEVSAKEEPYDIFICYKETDEAGGRTVDSAIAQDVYDALTEKGYRVFFSRISLEDKLGQEYEPYIFAALNSAKIMLAFGTDYEYFNAVWVKNEWSRFLQLIAAGQKKTLIPCYKDIDAYDMPKEFAKLQAQDMGKVGAIQDLLRGIEKILPKAANPVSLAAVPAQAAAGAVATTESLLRRAFMFLEDGDWQSADEYAEKVLDIEPETARAYLVKAMAELKIRTQEQLYDFPGFENNQNTKKALRFGNDALQNELNGYFSFYRASEEEKQKAREAARYALVGIYIEKRKQIAPVQNLLAAGSKHTLALLPNSLVISTKYIGDAYDGRCDVSGWTDVVAVAAGFFHSLGLKADGSVVAAGSNTYGRCDVSAWTDIVAVAAGANHSIGLKADGSVVTTGYGGNGLQALSSWKDIMAIAVGDDHFLGLKTDGSVLAAGRNSCGQCDVSAWADIVAVAAGRRFSLGLRADGTVLSSGQESEDFLRTVSGWSDIVAISAIWNHALGLKTDGTVVAAGDNDKGQCDVSSWTDIVAIAAGSRHSVGLRADGTVAAAGSNICGQCNVSEWKLFSHYQTIEKERSAALERDRARIEAVKRMEIERLAAEQQAEEQKRNYITALKKEKNALEMELPSLNGIFKSARKKEVENRLSRIYAELRRIGE